MDSVVNPVALVRKPQPNNARSQRVSKPDKRPGAAENGELERIIAATASAVLPSIIRIAVETAMRRSEIVGLRWEHIDLKRRVAHLPTTKNGSSRDVPLSGAAVAELTALKPKDTPQGRVFAVHEDAVTRAFERAVTRARNGYTAECLDSKKEPDPRFLADLRFHDLRHEATSRLATVFQLHELAKVTGHKDPRMLMRYYHPRAEDLAKKLR